MVTLAVALFTPAMVRAELADRILSVVGEDVVITASELALEEALRARDESPVPPFQDGGRDTLTLLEDYQILWALYGDIRLFQPDDRQVEARLDALRARFGDATSWRSFLSENGVNEADLSALLRRRLSAETAVRRNVGLAVQTSYPEAGPERDDAYSRAYDAWIAERRAELAIRRVEAR